MKKIQLSLLSIFILFSCTDNSTDVKEISKENNKIANAVPPGGCPEGTIWNNSIGKCVPENDPVINDQGDINVNKISFNGSVTEGPIPYSIEGYTQKVFGGQTIGGKKYSKLQVFYHGQPKNEILIVGFKNQNGYIYADYYDQNGKRFGQIVVSGNNIFQEFRPTYNGGVDSPDYVRKGFFGQWGRCVGIVMNQMTAGTLIGSASALGCALFAPECVGLVGGYCVIAAIHLDY